MQALLTRYSLQFPLQSTYRLDIRPSAMQPEMQAAGIRSATHSSDGGVLGRRERKVHAPFRRTIQSSVPVQLIRCRIPLLD